MFPFLCLIVKWSILSIKFLICFFPGCIADVCPANWAIEEYHIFNYTTNQNVCQVFSDNRLRIFILRRNQFRQLSTFPGSHPPSIIDVKELNFCVRHGNRWILLAIATGWSACTLKTEQYIWWVSLFLSFLTTTHLSMCSWSSPRTISTGQLHTLLRFHLRPINHVVFMDPYQITLWEILSWRGLHA